MINLHSIINGIIGISTMAFEFLYSCFDKQKIFYSF